MSNKKENEYKYEKPFELSIPYKSFYRGTFFSVRDKNLSIICEAGSKEDGDLIVRALNAYEGQ